MRKYKVISIILLSLSLLHCNENNIIEEETTPSMPVNWLVAGSISAISTSPDAIAWEKHNTKTNTELYDALHEKGAWIIVGEKGTILTSQNGVNWINGNSRVNNNLNKILFVDNRFFAFGEKGTVLSSVDGNNWAKVNTIGLDNKDIYDAHYHNEYKK